MVSCEAAAVHIDVFAAELGFIEGPVWNDATSTLSLVSIDRGCVYSLDAAGTMRHRFETGGGPNGLARTGDTLLVAQNGGIFGAAGTAEPGVQAIAGGKVSYAVEGDFRAPNDLAFSPDGLLYVTDPTAERAVLEPIEGRVFACDLRGGPAKVVIDRRLCPNGLAFTADGKNLLLALTQPRLVERFALRDRELLSEGVFCCLTNGRPDGLAIDRSGRLWVCTPGSGGIEIFASDGSFEQRIEVGQGSMVTNLCFGGADGRDVFVTAAGWGKVLRLRSEISGIPLYPGPEVDPAEPGALG